MNRVDISTNQGHPGPPDWTLADAETVSTLFLSLTVPLQRSPKDLRDRVESMLRSHGEPLRWAITSVDTAQQTVQVEAVVTQGRWTS